MTGHGASLLDDLRALSLDQVQVALLWLGQSSFAVHARGMLLLIDPFLSPHPDRAVPPPFPGAEAGGVDVVLCTHEHLDHFDAETVREIAAASPGARIVVPRPIVPLVADLGIAPERIVGVQPDEPVQLDGITIHPVPASHGVDVADAYTFGQELSGGLYRYLGYVLDLGPHVYHAGDTIPYEGMDTRLREIAVDLALLPINGRSPEREAQNLVGNLDHGEAVRLAAAIGTDLLVPMHYDMFPANPGYPEKLVELVRREYPHLAVLLPARERPFVYTRPTGR